MKNSIVIFEDDKFTDFYPLTYLRPVYFLRPGIRSLHEKIIDYFPGYDHHLFCRPELADLASEKTNLPVNNFDASDCDQIIFINGRLRLNDDFVEALKKAGRNAVLKSGDTIAAFKVIDKPEADEINFLKNGDLAAFYHRFLEKSESVEVELPFYNYLWDFIPAVKTEITEDFEYFHGRDDNDFLGSFKKMREDGREFPGVDILAPENIYISRDAEILPGVVLDATDGPIFLGTRTRVEPHTYVIGPTYVGKESILVGGKISASSIGPVCRAGGEVEEAIIQGYTNKYHAGFLGHAYLGEWINLGAMTTNSDLKNNYTSVSVSVNGTMIDTGSLKVGSFIGDFTKTAIGTLLNTGINIGLSCNIIAGGLVTDKEISSFTWYSPRHKMKYNFVKAIDTIERTMARRGQKLSEAARRRLAEINEQSDEHFKSS